MSTAIEALMHEHRIIEKVLEALERFSDAAAKWDKVERARIREFADFFRNFADRCHHGKEEDRLFAAMIEHGFARDQGPIAVMLQEHRTGREHVGALARIGGGQGPLTEDERRQLCSHALAYAALLKAHIQKEDNILYPMALGALPAQVMVRLKKEFDEFEKQVMGEGAHERYHDLAHQLADAFQDA